MNNDPSMRLIPDDKHDLEACENLRQADDEALIPHLDALLQCLQDLNWPIAGPVAERLAQMGEELVGPILAVLESDDEMWKYWIVCHLLHLVDDAVYNRLFFKLNAMRLHPTRGEVEDEVHDAVIQLMTDEVRR